MEDHFHGLIDEKGDTMGLKIWPKLLAKMIRAKMNFSSLVYLVSVSWWTLLI